MPATVRKGKKSGDWMIVDKASGRVKGHSSSKKNAQKSANARNAVLHGWKPTGGGRGKK